MKTDDLLAAILQVLQRLEAKLDRQNELLRTVRDSSQPVRSGPTSGQQ